MATKSNKQIVRSASPTNWSEALEIVFVGFVSFVKFLVALKLDKT